MKRVILALVICFIASFAHAGTRNNTGCGLGSLIFKDNDGLFSQVLAATTNGILGNQTFGITSGTLDCEQHTSLVQNKVIIRFVADNMDNLAKDIAMGHGESLTTLAELMEIPKEKRNQFYHTLQSNFDELFPAEDVTSIDVLNSIVKVTET